MSSLPRSTARLLTATVACVTAHLVVAPLVAGAGSSIPEELVAAAGSAVPVEDGAYPVTVEHAFGAVTIDTEPRRIVTIGLNDQDYVLAFGVEPVAVTYWNGDEHDATQVWTDEIVTQEPAVLNMPDGIDLEAVAAADPDLIIGLFAGVDEPTYELLSEIAPTVVRGSQFTDYGMGWQDTTMVVGAVLGRPQRAAELVAGLEQRFVAAATAHPEWSGVEFSLLDYNGTDVGVYGAADPRSGFFAELGLAPSAAADELAGSEHWATISLEQLDLVDADLVIWRASSDENVADIEAHPVIASMRSMAEDRTLYVGILNDVGYAQGWGTILSLPYAIDGVVPMLEAVVPAS